MKKDRELYWSACAILVRQRRKEGGTDDKPHTQFMLQNRYLGTNYSFFLGGDISRGGQDLQNSSCYFWLLLPMMTTTGTFAWGLLWPPWATLVASFPDGTLAAGTWLGPWSIPSEVTAAFWFCLFVFWGFDFFWQFCAIWWTCENVQKKRVEREILIIYVFFSNNKTAIFYWLAKQTTQ